MFNRGRSSDESGGNESDNDRTGAAESRSSETDLEQMLQRLDEMAAAAPAEDAESLPDVTGEATEQVESLRATVSAQKQAQRLLALATRMRNEASTESEQILLEAKGAAARLREEAETHAGRARADLAAWVAERRRAVETVVAELIDSANREAEEIRSDALRSAMSEADAKVRVYVARAQQEADRDAEQLRDQARAVLDRAASVLADAGGSMRAFADSMASQLVTLQRHIDLAQAVLDELESGDGEEAVDDLDEDLDLTADESGEPEEPEEPENSEGSEESGQSEDATRAEDAADAEDAAAAEDPDGSEGSAPTGTEAETAEDGDAGESGAPTAEPRSKGSTGRPLGSLFRDRDGR